ncbi:MAG: tetratricopeptide repeat protein [Vicinamibacterales bacterium]
MAENPRIVELRRRVDKDPASIAFAQLAEEYRRAGSYEEAIEACRSGLAVHPGYLSARVTLGRALLELNDLEAALGELEYVLKTAPENLAAIRGVAEIHHRRGALGEALGFYRAALSLAKHDPDLEQTVDEISRTLSRERPVVDDGLSFEQASAEFLAALEDLPGGLEAALAPTFAPDGATAGRPIAPDGATAGTPIALNAPDAPVALSSPIAPIAPGNPPALPKLERFLDAIHTHRQKKAV